VEDLISIVNPYILDAWNGHHRILWSAIAGVPQESMVSVGVSIKLTAWMLCFLCSASSPFHLFGRVFKRKFA
jgi:hypothetical protein